jgi:predicted RNase H-like HicB family nuclease
VNDSPRRYVVLIEPTNDGGFGAWAPDLPGCVALGNTVVEAAHEMRSAVAFHLEGLCEDGLPEPESAVATYCVEAPE